MFNYSEVLMYQSQGSSIQGVVECGDNLYSLCSYDTQASLSLLFSVHISILPSAPGNVQYRQPNKYCDVRAHAVGLSNPEVWFPAGQSVVQTQNSMHHTNDWGSLRLATIIMMAIIESVDYIVQ